MSSLPPASTPESKEPLTPMEWVVAAVDLGVAAWMVFVETRTYLDLRHPGPPPPGMPDWAWGEANAWEFYGAVFLLPFLVLFTMAGLAMIRRSKNRWRHQWLPGILIFTGLFVWAYHL